MLQMFDRLCISTRPDCGNKPLTAVDPVQEARDRLDYVRDRVAAFQRRYDKERSHSNLHALQGAVEAQMLAENELRRRVKAYG